MTTTLLAPPVEETELDAETMEFMEALESATTSTTSLYIYTQ